MAQTMDKPRLFICPARGKLYPVGLNEESPLDYKRTIKYKIIKIINQKTVLLKKKNKIT
jgi:hypothetical protein